MALFDSGDGLSGYADGICDLLLGEVLSLPLCLHDACEVRGLPKAHVGSSCQVFEGTHDDSRMLVIFYIAEMFEKSSMARMCKIYHMACVSSGKIEQVVVGQSVGSPRFVP